MDVPLKDHLEHALAAVYREFACQRDALAAHSRAAEERMNKAERDVERRLGETEKWRIEAVKSVTEKVGRAEWDASHGQLRTEVEANARRIDALINDRIGAQTAWGRVVTVAGVVAAVAGTLTGAVISLLHYFGAGGK
jgi:hypothetical protein